MYCVTWSSFPASDQKLRDLLRNNSTVGGFAAAAGASGQTLSIIQRGIKADNFELSLSHHMYDEKFGSAS